MDTSKLVISHKSPGALNVLVSGLMLYIRNEFTGVNVELSSFVHFQDLVYL